MYRMESGTGRYAPLYVYSFCYPVFRKQLEARQMTKQYRSYEEIQNVPDRLRWCRRQLGLTQKEAAGQVGITRVHYMNLEAGAIDYFARDMVDRLAALYRIPPDDLLDDYNRFLYKGQGKLIREYRESRKIKRRPFARSLGIHPELLRAWETEKKQVSARSWNKYLKNVIKV